MFRGQYSTLGHAGSMVMHYGGLFSGTALLLVYDFEHILFLLVPFLYMKWKFKKSITAYIIAYFPSSD
jgi:hypothetical protein